MVLGFKQMTVNFSKIVSAGVQVLVVVQRLSFVMAT